MERERVRVAVAGCHRMLMRDLAGHNFASAFAAIDSTEIVAVFDHGEEARAEFAAVWRGVWGEIATYGDFGQMLAEIRPDILCIATRQTMHADQVEAALEAGVRGILCDKPLATTLAEMDRIVAACAAIPLAFGLDRRWVQAYRYLREVLADGLLGRVSSLVAYGLPNAINHGCHWYDAILALLGDPEPIWVSGRLDDLTAEPIDSRRRMDPSASAQIGFDKDMVAYVTGGGPKGMGFDIAGEDGRLAIYADAAAASFWRVDAAEPEILSLPVSEGEWPAGTAMVNDLVQALHQGGRTACDIEEARRATEIGFALHSSAAQGGAIVALPCVDRTLRVESFPWGNE